MTKEQRRKCHKIIHIASVSAGMVGGGSAQIPMADSAVIIPIQLGMTLALAKVFEVTLDSATIKAALASKLATIVGQSASTALPGLIPGAGNVIKASTAATLTETMGWMMAKDFDEDIFGKTFDVEALEKIAENIN